MEIIHTKTSQCVDCYKCVRRCVVKSIQIKGGHAQVVPERCILDGRCVQVCPQSAKEVHSSLEPVKKLLKGAVPVVASLAPSFIAAFPDVHPAQIYAALLKLGFYAVEETSVAAYYVAKEYTNVLEEKAFVISTDCPSLVNLVEKYYPQYQQYLAPVVSPMIAHARMLSQAYRQINSLDIRIVFIGPCIAKIDETYNSDIEKEALSETISFIDLQHWFLDAGIEPAELPLPDFKNQKSRYIDSRLYPIEGGFLKSAGLSRDLNPGLKTITGFENCEHFFKEMPADTGGLRIVEMMICSEGCINGPLLDSPLPLISRRERIFQYATSDDILPQLFNYDQVEFNLRRTFLDRHFPVAEPTADDLKILMLRIGKYSRKDELDCGACGYYTCREKARAVFQGMAELEMCLPYMRKKAESRANKIIEQDPNGVVLMDNHYRIIQYNPAFRRIFSINDTQPIINQTIEDILGNNCFNNIEKSTEPTGFVYNHAPLSKTLEIIAFQLEAEDMLVGIFVDITSRIRNNQHLMKIKHETIEKTQEVIHKQMRVAQEIASLMGETTAETKVSLLKLITILKEESDLGE